MKIGLISDTHGFLDPRVPDVFLGVDHILHAGDVGMPWVLLQLEELAPVTAVLGNTDAGLRLRESEVTRLGGRTFFLQHILDPRAPAESVRRRLTQVQPDVVVFGHTHQAFEQRLGTALYINPGYAGRPKFAQPRSVAVFHAGDHHATLEFLPL